MRAALRRPARFPLRDQLLPRCDAVHPVRRRGDLPLSGRRAPEGRRHVRPDRDAGLRRAAGRGVRLRVAQRSARVEITRHRASDMLRGTDLSGKDLDEYVEQRVLTTTLDKALAWARSNALFP